MFKVIIKETFKSELLKQRSGVSQNNKHFAATSSLRKQTWPAWFR